MKFKFPKYLVEADFEAFDEGLMEWLPTRKLWVARMRDPFCLGLVDATASDGPASITVQFWPAVIEGDRKGIADKLCRALFRDHDLYPGDWTGPEIVAFAEEPGEFLHMVRPGSEAEFILDPHTPSLWRIHLTRDLDEAGVSWLRGFGKEPRIPEDTRRVGEFLERLR